MGKTEHPIRCKGEEVQSILDGRKTQMWLVIKPQPHNYLFWSEGFQKWFDNASDKGYAMRGRNCPYGQPGDTLWVQETWGIHKDFEAHYETSRKVGIGFIGWRASEDNGCPHTLIRRWRPSNHMPRWAARILLEVTAVRVERVQDITIRDAVAAGVELGAMSLDGSRRLTDTRARPPYLLEDWVKLWDSINAKGGFGWNSNPWAWAVTFKMRKKEL